MSSMKPVPVVRCVPPSTAVRRAFRWALLLAACAGNMKWASSQDALPPLVDLDSSPAAKLEEPSNVALALSIDFTTMGAVYRGAEYVHDLAHAPYLGYWDIRGCYQYKDSGDTSTLAGEYFYRVGTANGEGYCSNAYSGNLLNYVATSTIDILRLALTGGHRVVDTASTTVLERAYLYSDWGLNQPTYFPRRSINKAFLGKVVPNAPVTTTGDFIYAGSCKDKIWFGTRTADHLNCDHPTQTAATVFHHGDLNPKDADNEPLPMFGRVKVCAGSEATSRGGLCARYPSGNYKPIGQIQKKSDGIKISVFGYLADDSNTRYGGVLRAPMGYVGPTKPNAAGVGMIANIEKEWNQSTGVFVENPRNGPYAYSGVINYVNRFGTTGTKGYYKSLDPVGELYYEALRYFMGLGPTAAAVASFAGKEDGFPVYTNWTDPIENACYRKNYILTIGDVNTHYDRQLPGHGGSGALAGTTLDPARSAESLLGSGTFNAADWTKVIARFETDTNSTYTNSFGVSVSTKGNPNPTAGNNDLASKTTGSGGRAAYYWAGAAYWAHTQPIRNDTDAHGRSKSPVRVNTFAIDVDEGGNGSVEDTNPRGIKPRRSSFYLAGKYGWFNNADATRASRLEPLPAGALHANEQLDGHPFRNVLTGALDNSRWEYAGEPNTPDGYVVASQAKKMIEGVARFFNALGGSSSVRAASGTGMSSLDLSTTSPDGDLFVPQFDPKTWAGRLLKATMHFNQATGDVAVASTTWDAAKILTDASVASGAVTDPQVKPADRKLFTYSREGANRGGQIFSVAEKGKLDPAVLTALATKPGSAPAGTSDAAMQNAAIDWLRGDRSLEAGTADGYLRARTSVLGAIVNSSPVYKQGVSDEVTGPGFSAFAAAQKTRTAAVYVGADDGFLHAFKAGNGKELFAYMPRAVAESVHQLADPDYVHRPYVDAVPMVGEAQRLDGARALQWRTLLVSGMGGGAQGVFALDVTDPDNFSKDGVLFEFTDADDRDMGNVVAAPQLVRMRVPSATPGQADEYRWFVAVSSGYNNYRADGADRASGDGAQALFLLSVDKPAIDAWQENTNYFKMKLPKPTNNRAAALANPGVATDAMGNAIIFYAGDTQGNLWKFDFQSGVNAENARDAVKTKPLAYLKDAAGKVQPVTTVPQVAPGLDGGYMVIFGTGKYIEMGDANTTEGHSVYGIWDNLGTSADSDHGVTRAKLYARSFHAATSLATGAATFQFGKGTGQYRGWRLDLPLTGERVVMDPDTRLGYTAVNSFVPPADCAASGTGVMMTFDNLYGTSRSARDHRLRPLGKPRIVALDMSAADATTYTARTATGRRDLTIHSRPVSGVGGVGAQESSLSQGPMVSMKIPAGRVGWREIKNFEK
ncbi:PilC/PilY family type IV pilus protein [Ottowia sp.]|uniref:pilus assembly protein n=1 Tax=Ottowia sp. TaxID=1898956 RepID=UPI0025EB802D|nr:PilC/PilY family type IV pilus protein [Ottowia sp.]MBK6746568.1 hypothetical protein [Ottowia sp.]